MNANFSENSAVLLVKTPLEPPHQQQLEQALNWLRSGGWSLQTRWIDPQDSLSDWTAQQLDLGERCFISAGEDGFHQRVIEGLLLHAQKAEISPESLQIGLLPLGGQQDGLKNLGQADFDTAVQAILGRHTRSVDVLKVVYEETMAFALSHLEIFHPTNWWETGEYGEFVSLQWEGSRLDPRPINRLVVSNGRYFRGKPWFSHAIDDGEMALWRWFPRGRAEALWSQGLAWWGTPRPHHSWQGKRVFLPETSPRKIALDGVIRELAWREIAVCTRAVQIFSRRTALGAWQAQAI